MTGGGGSHEDRINICNWHFLLNCFLGGCTIAIGMFFLLNFRVFDGGLPLSVFPVI